MSAAPRMRKAWQPESAALEIPAALLLPGTTAFKDGLPGPLGVSNRMAFGAPFGGLGPTWGITCRGFGQFFYILLGSQA